MPLISSQYLPLSSSIIPSASSDTKKLNILFHPIDHVEINQNSFCNENDADKDDIQWNIRTNFSEENSESASKAEKIIPFTEDCRRCIKELIRHLGEVKENELLFLGLSKIIPGLPTDIIVAAHSLHMAVTERKNIDMAVLNILGLTSSYMLDNANLISKMAHFIRETLLEYVGTSYLGQFLSHDDDHSSGNFFMGLAILSIVAKHWMMDEGAPQRRLLQIPAFLGNLFLRASTYWNHLGRIAQHATETCHFTIKNNNGNHSYICVQEANSIAQTARQISNQKSWLCTKTEKEDEINNMKKICYFPQHAQLPHDSNQQIEKYVAQKNSATADKNSKDIIQPLMLASAVVSTTSVQNFGLRGGVLGGAALAFTGTALVVGGKLIRDTFLSINREEWDKSKSIPLIQAPLSEKNKVEIRLKEENMKIIRFLQKKSILDLSKKPHQFNKEEIVSAVAQYLITEMNFRKKNIARCILNASDMYGGKKEEKILIKKAEFLNRKWFFENILGSIPEIYIAEKTAKSDYSFRFTIASMKYLLSINRLQEEGNFNFKLLSDFDIKSIKIVWENYLKKEIPLIYYYANNTLFNAISLDDIEFASLHTGSFFLHDNDIDIAEIDKQEIINTGNELWNMALHDGVNSDMIKYYSIPALFFQAMNFSYKTINRKIDNDFIFVSSAVKDYIDYRKKIYNALENFHNELNEYNDLIKKWLPKGIMADNIIEKCPKNSIIPLPNKATIMMTQEQIYTEGKKQAKQKYLSNFAKPCQTAPDNINDEYEKETNNVANKFSAIDEFMIFDAFGNLSHDEKEFIRSKNAIINIIDANLEEANKNLLITAYQVMPNKKIFKIKKTDLISVKVDDIERIYALKGKSDIGYELLRVDRNLSIYIKKNIFDFDLHGKQYKIEKNTISVDIDTFIFNICFPEEKNIHNQGDNIDNLMSLLKNKHRDSFYNALYKSGNDEADIKKIWIFVKSFIPFFDCIEGVINKNSAQAIPACVIDFAFIFIPIGGQIAALNTKFAMGIVKGLKAGGKSLIENAITKNTLKLTSTKFLQNIYLPNVNDLSSLGYYTLRNIDPGFLISKKYIKKIVKHLEKNRENSKLDNVIKKLKSLELKKQIHQPIIPDFRLKLQGTNIEIPVKKIARRNEQDIFAEINLDTGEIFGKKYIIDENIRLQSQNQKMYTHRSQHEILLMEQNNQQIQIFQNNQLYNIDNIPNLTGFMNSLSDYRSIFYENRDFSEDIICSVKNYYNSENIYQHSFRDNPLNIPAQFDYLKTNIDEFNAEVNDAFKNAETVLNIFDRTTMNNDNGILNYSSNNVIRSYFSKVLHTKDENIIREAMTRFKFHVQKIVSFFKQNSANIYFATSSTPTHPYIYNVDCPMGFVYPGDTGRKVTIMVDNYKSAPISSTQPQLTALHEISHFSGSGDFLLAPSTSQVGDASEFMEVFNDAIHYRNGEVIAINKNFINAYKVHQNNDAISDHHFIQLLRRDPMLKVNAFMENADFIAKFISDIGQNIKPNNNYINQRNRREATSFSEKNGSKKMIFSLYKLAMISK